MNKKVLVVYASKVGSTAQVAQAIADVLAEGGIRTDVRAVAETRSVKDYGAVVLGSAIRFGKVLPEVQRFVEANRSDLLKVPVAYFVCCMTLQDDTQANRETVRAYLDPLVTLVPPVDFALFAGTVDVKKLAPMLRAMVNAMKAPQGDFRDWEAIRRWAAGLPAVLVNENGVDS